MSELEQLPPWVIPAVCGVVLTALLSWVVFVWRRRRAAQRIESLIDSISYDVLRNVLIPNGMEGQIILQYLLLTERGLLVLDLIERPGSIFGGDQMVEWTSIGKKTRYTFRNPQHVLYDRMAAVKLLAGSIPVDGRVVFTMRSDFPKGKSTYVMRVDELAGEFNVVDRTRVNVVSAFADVWNRIKRITQSANSQSV
jgi:hypothetical protein